ncbi:hypothetical protein HELRODRAFT_160107 [Helobdella robusta]|uniref:Endonuclease/exonuclease/phosphatase domain-containing protein n=1 Tax=Helobdella robusta TaxID=6412 RepID=T1EPT0_HELRO|nr:hypothetical protein HELRODRAFT_160107 [Helobdella robusta]ESO06001.1 hypothetical protein HELRODRAFT_160107 [Helobdella robusta]
MDLSVGFKKYICVQLSGYTEDLNFLLVYRSPNSDLNNNSNLLVLLKKFSKIKGQKIYVGDFNLPNIDWDLVSTPGGVRSMESMFLNCVRDLYLHQLVSKATRFRTSQKSNILDLILVHDKDVVANIDYNSPIGNSDHIVLVFVLRHTWNLVRKRAKQKYNFNKGEYDKMRVCQN